MNCKNTELYMDALLDNELSVKDNLEVLSHIENCGICKEKWDLNEETRTGLKMFVGSIKAPKSLQEEILKRINYKQKSFAAVLAIISAIFVPVVIFSIKFLNQTQQLHQMSRWIVGSF